MNAILVATWIATAPSTHTAAETAYKAVERPILLARLQGHWYCALTDTDRPDDPRPLMQELTVCGSRYYYRGLYLLGQPAGRWTTSQIEGISPTSLRAYCVQYRGKPPKGDNRANVRYAVREGGLEFGEARYQRVPPGWDPSPVRRQGTISTSP
jgi:hypothetical protein